MKTSLFRYSYGIAIALAVVYAFYTLRGPRGIPGWIAKQQEIRALEDRNSSIGRENELKKERIQRLRRSGTDQEQEIRERLRMVKPNEKVYILK